MFLQLPLTRMQIRSQRANDDDSSAIEDKINSAVRKAGSFEGTLPRCFSSRFRSEQPWAKALRFRQPEASFKVET